MPKYLVEASYTPEGVRGLQKEGAVARVDNAAKVAAALGGKCDVFHWSFGNNDVVAIFDLPSSADAAALALAVSASGLVHAKTTPLLTAPECDLALKKSVAFRPPGK